MEVSAIKHKLRTQLSLSYVAITLICVILISVFANVLLERQFQQYIMKKQEDRNQEVLNTLIRQYERDKGWDAHNIGSIGINALENGLIINILDENGNEIWDAVKHNSGLCEQMISHMAKNMNSRYGNWKGEYTETKYEIKYKLKQIGSLEVGYYGPFYLMDNDLKFINALNELLLGIAVFVLMISLVFGAIMSRRISNPILSVIKSTKLISRGCYGKRIIDNSDTKEIHELIVTINMLAETLERQETLRKRMTSDVAHELRTPLTTLQGHIEAMIDGIWEPTPERLKSCHEEILRINRMVGDLEKLTLLENENIKLNKTNFNISKLVQNIATNFESDFVRKSIELHVTGEDVIATADRDKISQVVINLLSNSLKYTNELGKVNVEISSDKDNIQLTIIDTGIGMLEEDIPYIFERFYRVDKSRNRLTGGSGIGLTITKAIVEAHKGTIEVKSKIGEGTEFSVKLPKKKSIE